MACPWNCILTLMYISHQDDGYLWINHCNNMRTCHDPRVCLRWHATRGYPSWFKGSLRLNSSTIPRFTNAQIRQPSTKKTQKLHGPQLATSYPRVEIFAHSWGSLEDPPGPWNYNRQAHTTFLPTPVRCRTRPYHAWNVSQSSSM